MILEAAGRAQRGEPVEPECHISFENWPIFFRTMTATRLQLLQYIHSYGTVRSLRALALGLGRDYRRSMTMSPRLWNPAWWSDGVPN